MSSTAAPGGIPCPGFALRPAALDTQRYKRFAAFLKHQGVIGKILPVADYATELK